MWWDNIKMLSELSSQQSPTSMFVNGTGAVLQNEHLSEATGYIILLSNVRRYCPFGLSTYPSYKRSSRDSFATMTQDKKSRDFASRDSKARLKRDWRDSTKKARLNKKARLSDSSICS